MAQRLRQIAARRACRVFALAGLVWLLAAAPVLAQASAHWRFLTAHDGLAEAYVSAVTVGPTGMVWLSHGAVDTTSRYDGLDVQRFPSPGQLVPVFETRGGQLWSILPDPLSGAALQRLTPSGWVVYPVPGAGTIDLAHAVVPLDASRAVVALPDGLVMFDATVQSWTRPSFPVAPILPLVGLTRTRNGDLVVLGRRGFVRLDALQRAETHVVPAGLGERPRGRAFEGDDGAWLLTAEDASGRHSVIRFADGRWSVLARAQARRERLTAWPGVKGTWWLAREHGAGFQLSLVDGNREESPPKARVLSGAFRDVAVEPGGIFWLATSLGAARYAPPAWRLVPEVAMGELVNGLLRTPDGRLYALSTSAILTRAPDGGAWSAMRLPDAIAAEPLLSNTLQVLADGRVVFSLNPIPSTPGIGGEVFELADGRVRRLVPCSSTRHAVLGRNRKGDVLIGSYASPLEFHLEAYDGRTITRLGAYRPRWITNSPRQAIELANGEVWVGFPGGMVVCRNGSCRAVDRGSGYTGIGALALLEVRENAVWAGDRTAIFEYAGGGWTMAAGRAFETVRKFRDARDGSVWVASGSGLHRFKDGSWVTVDAEDGLPNAAVYDVVEDADGVVWAGTTAGLVRWHAEADRDAPRAVITADRNPTEFAPGADARFVVGGIDRWSFTTPSRLLLSTRVDNGQWSPFSNATVVTASGLSAGPHALEVRAMDTNWNAQASPVAFAFRVLRPWYAEPAFVAVVSLGSIVILALAGLHVSRYFTLNRLVAQRTASLEAANAQLRSEMRRIAEAEAANQALEERLRQSQKMEAIGQLAAGVAHDFNNLLVVISGYSALLAEDTPADDPRSAAIEEIRRAGERAEQLTRQLLAFGRRQVVQRRLISLNDVVRNLDRLLARLLREDIVLVSVLAPDLRPVLADPSQVEQVVVNLAVNARDAMSAGGRLTIATENVEVDESYARVHPELAPGLYAALSITDTGVGMPPEVRARAFEPFFTTKPRGHGTGLGLATVYGIAVQNGGAVHVYSEVGRGSSFKVYFPAAAAAGDDTSETVREAVARRGHETVLVVEDEDAVRRLATTVLEQQGYTVLSAPDGTVALELAAQPGLAIDLVLTDVVMPGLNGREMADRLRGLQPEAHVLYMSGYPDDAVVQHGILDPRIAYLQKPFTTRGLCARVRDVLDGRSAPRADA